MIGFKHPVTQRLRRLVRKRSARDAEGVFVVEGSKVLTEALDAGVQIEALFVADEYEDDVVMRLQASESTVPLYRLRADDIARVADTVTPQPVMAIVRRMEADWSVLAHARQVLVLADVRDPGNAGTALRSAESAGIDAVVFCGESVDVFSPKTVRSSAGAVFHVPVVTGPPIADTFVELRAGGFVTIGTTMEGGQVYDHCDLTRKVAIVMGNEANGLTVEDQLALDEMVSIPTEGRTESLNVSMAASVLVFEVARQLRAKSDRGA